MRSSCRLGDRRTDRPRAARVTHFLTTRPLWPSLPLSSKVLNSFKLFEEECRRPHTNLDLTGHLVGLTGIGIFLLAYATVILEEQLSRKAKFHKSISMTIAAGLNWVLIAFEYR